MVGEISDLYVSEELRGQGTGRQLVSAAMQWFTDQKVHSVEVQIMAQNRSGLTFGIHLISKRISSWFAK